ncbi:MAG: cell division ATP-binding protein FtsE [Candidatus Margulisbacteria bacterium]|jgi:cell division transport system ATP-binding protein|nr:cell division ATP-binding protein FtsE [Candidatus Margulisiibacteriota bacterium]
MIELTNVFKTYSSGIESLYDINLHIGKEEFVFLVGSSGAGKTTLLKLVYREERPTSGKVVVDRVNVAELDASQIPFLRRNIGVVFQDFKLLAKRTVFENVAFALRVTGAPRSTIRRKAMQALELVGMLRRVNSFPHELSGGEKQRVCIARAIVNNPPILLADEPTGNLDPATSWDILQLLDKINKRNTTVVVATHNKSIVDEMKKRVVVLENGRLVRDQQLGMYHV